jgi:two-component system LytT family sensor kinase
MTTLAQHPQVQLLLNNRNYRFLLCQLAGWGGYSLVTFLSITLVDDNVSWPHIGHLFLSAILGMLITWPLRPLYNHTFNLSISTRLVVSLCAVAALSGVWNVLRVLVFAWLVGEKAVWDEFNYWYFGSLSIFLGWSVLYYAIKYYELLTLEHQKLLEESSLKKEEQFARLQAESSARHAQLQMLRYQLNPHFLFNTLNAINALVTLNENHKAGEMIQQLGDFLRHTLEHGDLEEVSLGQELESLMLYLNIERTRFEDRLILDFEIEPLARQALIPGLILQPIVENSMKYAIAASEEGGTVRVSARIHADELELEVSDSGPGASSEQISDGHGIGLNNTIQRLETLYPNAYSFNTFEGSPSGLTVIIRIPFKPAPMAKQHPGGEK